MTDWMDSEIKELYEEHGEKTLEKSEDPFKRILTSIINQQISTEAGAAIQERFFDRFELTPESVLEADEDRMSDVGLSSQKIDYMKSAAEHFIEDDLTAERFGEMSDEEVIEEMTEIRGIGDWTAKMFLMFALGREDVFPVEDLGIRRAMAEVYGIESRKEMREKAEEWRPKRSIASLYLWEFRND
ncbi:DNA-3-methyladenine glycosylase family protein [Candidatus Nanohalococcus occultus]|uniref:DNA-3-methyladenine glycosylase family protein n=1 Tax=Candidatus Nanohalococcus occultus TaxID=2978047 RepID=UPI0039E004E4